MFPITTPDKNFHDGDGQSVLGTIVPAKWLNDVQWELLNILLAAKVEPDDKKQDQVATAIKNIFSSEQALIVSQSLIGTSKTKTVSEDALRRVNITAENGVSDAKVAKEKADQVGIQAGQNALNLEAVKVTAEGAIPKRNISHQASDAGQNTVPSSALMNVVYGQVTGKVNLSDSALTRGVMGAMYWPNNVGSSTILRWGVSSGTSHTFPVAFPNVCQCVLMQPAVSSTAALSATAYEVRSITRTGFVGGLSSIDKYFYFAIGY